MPDNRILLSPWDFHVQDAPPNVTRQHRHLLKGKANHPLSCTSSFTKICYDSDTHTPTSQQEKITPPPVPQKIPSPLLLFTYSPFPSQSRSMRSMRVGIIYVPLDMGLPNAVLSRPLLCRSRVPLFWPVLSGIHSRQIARKPATILTCSRGYAPLIRVRTPKIPHLPSGVHNAQLSPWSCFVSPFRQGTGDDVWVVCSC